MKYLKTFESHSKKEVKEDEKYYKKFQSLTKSEINDIRKEWKELRHEALKNLNDDLRNNYGKEGSIGGSDVEDVELYKYLKGDKLKKFKEASRILDFEVGYSKKKMNENVETTDKLIKTTYQTITPESAEKGDFEDQGWEDEEGKSMTPDEYDIEEGITAVDKTVEFLRNNGASEESNITTYSTVDPERNYKTGAEKYYSFHLYGFTPEEEIEISKRMKLK